MSLNESDSGNIFLPEMAHMMKEKEQNYTSVELTVCTGQYLDNNIGLNLIFIYINIYTIAK